MDRIRRRAIAVASVVTFVAVVLASTLYCVIPCILNERECACQETGANRLPVELEMEFRHVTNDISQAFRDVVLAQHTVIPCAFRTLEVVKAATNAVGYFSEIAHTNLLEHSHVQGAWRWVGVGVGDNEVGGDTVGVMELFPPWGSGGFLSWPIPNVYRRKGETWISEPFCNTDQSVTLEPNGTVWLEKFNRIESCTTNRHFNGWIRINQ